MNWFPIENIYEIAISKMTHKILNNVNNNDHYFLNQLTMNRSIRFHAENKIGPHPIGYGLLEISQKTFLYQIRNTYNELPK